MNGSNDSNSPAARVALLAFVLAMLIVHGVVASTYPLLGGDWGQLMWSERHETYSSSRHAWAFFVTHFTLADAAGFTLAHYPIVHTIVTPFVTVALVFGVFAVAFRRLPRASSWDDVLAIVLISALIWITQPRAGLVFFYRPFTATHLYGAALAIWFIAPYRCRWELGGWRTVVLVTAGLFVGVTTRQIATPVLLGIAYAIWRTPRAERARWMRLGLISLFVGTIVGYLDPPPIALATVLRRGFEINATLLNLPFREGGELITLVLLLVLAKLILEALGRGGAIRELPNARETLTWFWTWLAIAVFSLFGPRYSEATLLPATLVLCIAALPYFVWISNTRWLRFIIIGLALGVHFVTWSRSLMYLVPLGAEFRARMAALEKAPPGSIGVIAPYSSIRPSFSFFGEDWSSAASRQLLAIKLFGLRDIHFSPSFRRLETNPLVEIRLETEGLTAEQLAAAHAPALWATELGTARTQFKALITKGLEPMVGKSFKARLVVTNLELVERKERPLLAAWYEDGKLFAPFIRHTNPDANNRQTVRVPSEITSAMPEAYVVHQGKAQPTKPAHGGFRLQPLEASLFAVVTCDADRCLVADAFVPRF